MADALTPNYNFTKPEVGASDDTWGGKLNANWASLDTLLKSSNDNIAGKVNRSGDTMTGDLTVVNLTATTNIKSGRGLISTGVNLILACLNVGGGIFLRPNGDSSTVGELSINQQGTVAVSGNTASGGVVTLTSAYSTNGTDNQVVGNILVRGYSSTGVLRAYGDWYVNVISAANGAENGQSVFRVMSAGVLSNSLLLGPTSVYVPHTTASSSYNTGGLVVAGGLGVGGTIQVASHVGSANGNFYAGGGMFCSNTATVILSPTAGAGDIYLRPNGAGSNVGEARLSSGGHLTLAGNIATSAGTIQAGAGIFYGNATVAVLGPTSVGGIYLRPKGAADPALQTTIDGASGTMAVGGGITAAGSIWATTSLYVKAASGNVHLWFQGPAGEDRALVYTPAATQGDFLIRVGGTQNFYFSTVGNLTVPASVGCARDLVGTFHATGVTAGTDTNNGRTNSSATVSAGGIHYQFYNPSGSAGNITTTNATTAFNTASDERLKEFNAEMDPAQAIAIIRADPVLSYTWKATGDQAVGWFAQRSHAVNEDLATYIPAKEAGEKDEPAEPEFWGIDYGKRTPYLWAALTWALDEIDMLKAKMDVLDPKPMRKKAA